MAPVACQITVDCMLCGLDALLMNQPAIMPSQPPSKPKSAPMPFIQHSATGLDVSYFDVLACNQDHKQWRMKVRNTQNTPVTRHAQGQTTWCTYCLSRLSASSLWKSPQCQAQQKPEYLYRRQTLAGRHMEYFSPQFLQKDSFSVCIDYRGI